MQRPGEGEAACDHWLRADCLCLHALAGAAHRLCRDSLACRLQGEERAALNRASFDMANDLRLGPSDLILFSAKVATSYLRMTKM